MTQQIVAFDPPVKRRISQNSNRKFDSLPYIQLYTTQRGGPVSVRTSTSAIRNRGVRPSRVVSDVVRLFGAEIVRAKTPFLLVHDERQGFYATEFLAASTTSCDVRCVLGSA